jgi:alcohol dehydrogenase
MDALTHAIEAFTVKGAAALSDAAALYAIELIWRHLRTAVRRGDDIEGRAGMMLGSLLAGIAFSHADVGSVHCIAEALGGKYDLPHGVCNAVLLPTVMRYNRAYCQERYARIATAMGLGWSDPEQGASKAVEAVEQLSRDVGLPPFTSFGINPRDFGEIAANSAKNGSNPSNCRPMTAADYEIILEEMQGKMGSDP